MIYNVLSIIFIALLALISIAYSLAIFTKGRSKRIEFIRKFKKGNCAVVYFVAIPLYFAGHIYAGESLISAFFSAISKTLSLVVLSYDSASIADLMADNRIYTVAVYFCFVLVTVNAMLFALSFLHQKIWELYQRNLWSLSNKEKLLIVGNNEDNLGIYFSEKKREAIIVDDIPDEEKAKLFAKRVRFVSLSVDNEDNAHASHSGIENFCCELLLSCLTNAKRSCILVVNTRDDTKNIAVCRKIISCTRELFKKSDPAATADKLARIKIYVFGSPAYEAIYNEIVESSNGCISYVNKYRKIAMDFVDRYPLTQFMTSRQIDYSTSLLHSDVDVNVAMIGFGKTNQQIFLTSVANNQFLVNKDGKTVLRPIHYHIFDKHHSEKNKNLNHSYYRFKNEFEEKILEQEKGGDHPYLPFPALPADDHYYNLDVNDPDFYKELKTSLSGDKKYNYVIIGFGCDLENIDMAQKILEKKQEWGLEDTYVFVKVRGGNDSYPIFDRSDCYMIGDEQRSVYNVEQIDDNAITAMAKKRNRIYALEFEITSTPNKLFVTPIDEVYKKADCDWYIKKTQFERESNLYACLSLRQKLHLMGMDYVAADSAPSTVPISKETYISCYAADDMPIYYEDILADGKEIVKYDLNFKKSRRNTMAIHEHYRWNSFMLTKGFVPSCKAEILNSGKENGKNYLLRKHGNLTTFEGLLEFRKLLAEKYGVDEILTDVIKYDYQLLDDAYWLLTDSNYKIVSRSN